MPIEGYIIAEDGSQRCDTDKCGAVCCKASSYRADKPGPCEFLTPDLKCELHNIGGSICKPYGCYLYPRSQLDIEMVNAQAEAAGFAERCLLKVS